MFCGCHIFLMTSWAMEKVKASMRWATMKVDTFLAVPVTGAFLSKKYIKRFRKNRTYTFPTLSCTTCHASVYHVLFRVWIVSSHAIKTGQVFAMKVYLFKI